MQVDRQGLHHLFHSARASLRCRSRRCCSGTHRRGRSPPSTGGAGPRCMMPAAPGPSGATSGSRPTGRPGAHPFCTSLLHIPFAYPFCTSLLHIPYAYPLCISLMHIPSAYPLCIFLLHIPCTYPLCISLMHIPYEYPLCTSLVHISHEVELFQPAKVSALSMQHTWTIVQHDGPNHLGICGNGQVRGGPAAAGRLRDTGGASPWRDCHFAATRLCHQQVFQ